MLNGQARNWAEFMARTDQVLVCHGHNNKFYSFISHCTIAC